MTVLTLKVPGRPQSANDRGHWSAKARATRETREQTKLHALVQWGVPARWPKLAWPVMVEVQDQCRTANLRDSANAAPAVKAICDQLTAMGLWPDDSAQYVACIVFLPAVKTGADALVLTIRDAEETQ